MTTRILVVDDEFLITKSIERLLSEENIEVLTETDPVAACELLKSEIIDILITDQMMPKMSGLELIKHFQIESPETIIILMSAYTDYQVMRKAINECHVFYFIQKPWSPDELLNAIQMAIHVKQEKHHTDQIIKSYLINNDRWMEALEEEEVQSKENVTSVVAAFKKIIEVKDKELYIHSMRVADVGAKFAAYLRLDPLAIEATRRAGEFHDLGKIVIKDRILYKESKLSADEFEEMKVHPSVGAEVLREIDALKDVAEIVEQHHERFDGEGYPKGLRGNEIRIEAKIISISDAFDALTSERAYKKILSRVEAFEIMTSGKAGAFDTTLLTAFIDFVHNNY